VSRNWRQDSQYEAKFTPQTNLNDPLTLNILKTAARFNRRPASEAKVVRRVSEATYNCYRKGKVNKTMTRIFSGTHQDLKLQYEKSLKIQEDIAKDYRHFHGVKKLFKLPLMKTSDKVSLSSYYDVGTYVTELSDRTFLLRLNSRVEREAHEDSKVLNLMRAGLGIDVREDMATFHRTCTLLSQDTSKCFKDRKIHRAFEKEDWYKVVKENKVFEYLYNFEKVAREICYLEGRRKVMKGLDGVGQIGNKFAVGKAYKGFTLFLKGGSQMTKEKAIRFCIMVEDGDQEGGMYHHSWLSSGILEMKKTKWLTMTLSDLKHFSVIFNVAVSLCSHYKDLIEETHGMVPPLMESLMKLPCIIPMIHKRGLSTTLQLNRYILHSGTALATDRIELMKTIFKDPVRGVVEGVMRLKQADWLLSLDQSRLKRIRNHLLQVNTTDAEYDRLYVPSFWDNSVEVEFSVAMNDIYLCNLFEKESGYSTHRAKAIISKTLKEEKNSFYNVRGTPESQGEIKDYEDFISKEDQHHTFDKKSVMAAGKLFWNKISASKDPNEELYYAFMDTLRDTMTTKSSLRGGPVESDTMAYRERVEKDFAFNTVYQKVCEMSTATLIGMCQEVDILEAFFSLFPKAQIGGPREILIQAVTTRIFVKFMERMCVGLAKLHSKEMLTGDKEKLRIQTETLRSFKQKAIRARFQGRKVCTASLNADASRWSPSMVMEELMYFVMAWNCSDWIKDYFLSVIRSFSYKSCFLPEALVKNWSNRTELESEAEEDMEWLRLCMMDTSYCVKFLSGMGQGMFHFLSTVYHCGVDDYTDQVLMMRLPIGMTMEIVTVVSSDDKTKMIYLEYSSIKVLSEWLFNLVFVIDSCSRLCNIHTNWKKTALQLIITEFNSVFSIGMRMVLASIKDVYTAVQVVDLTAPEFAVREVSSNLSRAFLNGVYLTTLTVMAKLMRQSLMDWYCISEEVCNNLCSILNCGSDQLPYHLGFLPLDYLLESSIYGLDFHMFKGSNSNELKLFYKGVHSKVEFDEEALMFQDKYLTSMSFSTYRMELPARIDKDMQERRQTFYGSSETMKAEVKHQNKVALMVNRPRNDPGSLIDFARGFYLGIKRNYTYSTGFATHSMVRALQYGTDGIRVIPTVSLTTEEKVTLRGLDSKSKKEAYLKQINEKVYSVEEFVRAMLKAGSQAAKTSLRMKQGMRVILDTADRNREELKTCARIRKRRHAKLREIRFFTTRVWKEATEREVINFLFKQNEYDSTRITSCVDDLLSIFDETASEVRKNPFLAIKNMFSNSSRPFLDFKQYLSFSQKVLRFTTKTMVSDSPDTGNMRGNLMNLLMTRSNPKFCYVGRSANEQEEVEEFKSWVALSSDPYEFFSGAESKEEESETVLDNTHNDADVMFALSRLKAKSEEKGNLCSELKSERCVYGSRRQNDTRFLTYFDFRTLVVAQESKRSTLLWIYSMVPLEDSKTSLLRLLMRDMDDWEYQGKQITLMEKDVVIQTRKGEISYSLVEDIEFQTRIVHKRNSWSCYLDVMHSKVRGMVTLWTSEYNVKFGDCKNSLLNEEILDLMSLMRGDMDIVQMGIMFHRKNWLRNDTTVCEAKQEVERSYNDSDFFSASLFTTMLPSLISARGAAESEKRDRDEARKKKERREDLERTRKLREMEKKADDHSRGLFSKFCTPNPFIRWEDEEMEDSSESEEEVAMEASAELLDFLASESEGDKDGFFRLLRDVVEAQCTEDYFDMKSVMPEGREPLHRMMGMAIRARVSNDFSCNWKRLGSIRKEFGKFFRSSLYNFLDITYKPKFRRARMRAGMDSEGNPNLDDYTMSDDMLELVTYAFESWFSSVYHYEASGELAKYPLTRGFEMTLDTMGSAITESSDTIEPFSF
jgi:hypothetical protein